MRLRLPLVARDGLLAVVVALVQAGALFNIPTDDPTIPPVLGLHGDPLLGTLAVLAASLPLAWRRRSPLPVLGVVAAGTIAQALLRTLTPPFGLLIAAYSVGAHAPRRQALLGIGVVVTTALAALAAVDALVLWNAVVMVGAAGAIGDRQQHRRRYLAALEERAARLEHEREDAERLAVASERARIARELHDVVAHSVSLMVVQAGAARHNLARNPGRAEEAITEVEATGRASLAELRRLLGVLRQPDEGAALAPQPGLHDLGELVEGFRSTGLPVRLEVTGQPRPLAQGVDLSLYRIVQEALTNALKHAAATRVLVRLRYDGDEVTLTVDDDGVGAAAGVVVGGHGLVGMRERAALLGGSLEYGPRDGGGFAVAVTLPVRP
jgi:signal transduction histidine kinase